MRTRYIVPFIALMVMASACSQHRTSSTVNAAPANSSPAPAPAPQDKQNQLILVQGGTFKDTKSNYYGKSVTVADFYIGKYEVTQQEWAQVMGSNPSEVQGDGQPVEMVNWYEAVEYCNKRSIQEGLQPYYNIDKNNKDPNNLSDHDDIKWTVTANQDANGYRLPTEAEWEYAASGGQLSKSYAYSGSDNADDVAWYWRNDGDEYLSGDWNWPAIENNHGHPQAVGDKQPNELGLYDMSGNVREWCWDWFEDSTYKTGLFRVVRGGGWIGDVVSSELTYRGKYEANGMGPDQGLRVVRNG